MWEIVQRVKNGVYALYRLGLAHFATFETLVFRFQALLQIQRLLLIPTYFALSPASKQSNV
jgi:hypothetical protein